MFCAPAVAPHGSVVGFRETVRRHSPHAVREGEKNAGLDWRFHSDYSAHEVSGKAGLHPLYCAGIFFADHLTTKVPRFPWASLAGSFNCGGGRELALMERGISRETRLGTGSKWYLGKHHDLPRTKAWACSHFHVGVSTLEKGRNKVDGSNGRVLSLRLLFQACGCCKCPIVSLRLLQAINMEAFSAGGIAASRTVVRRRYTVPHSTGLAKCFQAANAPSPTAPPDEVINMPLPQSSPVGISLEPLSN